MSPDDSIVSLPVGNDVCFGDTCAPYHRDKSDVTLAMSVRYSYIAAVFHGISLQHFASLSKAVYQQVDRNAQKKSPRFNLPLSLTIAAMAVTALAFLTMFYSARYLMYSNADGPITELYYFARYAGALMIHIPALLIHALILTRLFVFHKRKSPISIACICLTLIHFVGLVLVIYYTTTVMVYETFYTAPNSRIWMLANGVCLITDCIMNVTAAAVFIQHLAHELNVSLPVLLWSLFFKYGGPKWVLFLGLNGFTVYVIVSTALIGSTTASAAQYRTISHRRYRDSAAVDCHRHLLL
ncbi:hypothetical protein EDD86DRAFT_199775 [Gorgonomyces haynaldii]|nr:hypothetical protein EDD86DRAFT_199775 [Gorgonomyces haynaldii]